MRAGATTEDPIGAVDLVAFVVLRQALTGLSDHGDERVRQFAAGAGGDLIAHQVAPSVGAIVAFLDGLEQGVSLLRLHLGRERRARAMAGITASTATREVPESRLLGLHAAILRARRPLKSWSVATAPNQQATQ